MKVWVTRAEPGASATAERVRTAGHPAIVGPLLEVRPLPAPDLPQGGVGALAFTSAAGVRAATAVAAVAQRWRGLPVFAVGDATAEAARRAGFSAVTSAKGDVRALARLVTERRGRFSGEVLHLGAQNRAGDLAGALSAAGVPSRTVALYETVALPLPSEVRARWSELRAVTIHSPRAARAFFAATAGLDASHLIAACISSAAATPLYGRTGEVRVAAEPNDSALLARLGKPLAPR